MLKYTNENENATMQYNKFFSSLLCNETFFQQFRSRGSLEGVRLKTPLDEGDCSLRHLGGYVRVSFVETHLEHGRLGRAWKIIIHHFNLE